MCLFIDFIISVLLLLTDKCGIESEFSEKSLTEILLWLETKLIGYTFLFKITCWGDFVINYSENNDLVLFIRFCESKLCFCENGIEISVG